MRRADTPPRDDESIDAQAADWLVQRDAGWSAAEAAAFDRWLAQDPRHAAAVARLQATWSLLRELGAYRPEARSHPDPDLLAPRRAAGRHRTTWRAAFTAAAAIALIALGWTTGLAPFTRSTTAREFATTTGGYQRLTLPDGSIMELNADSEVRIDYTPQVRRLRLIRGEAHFTVMKDAARPFLVETDHALIRAVGTSFDVRLAEARVEVVVTAGTVAVQRDGAATALDAPHVHAGWRAIVPIDRTAPVTVLEMSPREMRYALAWHGRRLTFVETPLAEVVQQFNRRNTVQLELADPALGNIPIGGSFDADAVQAFVRLLGSGGEIVSESPSPDRIILRRAREP